TGPVRLPRKGVVSLTDPRTQAPTFVRPVKSDGRSTMYAISEASARSPSESMAPPPTGSASVSTSSCLEEDELLTRLCHPEIAPHAMATNRMGQIGPRIPWGSNKNGPDGMDTGMFAKGVASAPTRSRMIAAYDG